MQIKVEKFSQKCLKNFNHPSLNKQISHLGSATSHCLTSDCKIYDSYRLSHTLTQTVRVIMYESQKMKKKEKFRMSPKLRKTKGLSLFYKSDFDISPIETKIRKFKKPVSQSQNRHSTQFQNLTKKTDITKSKHNPFS